MLIKNILIGMIIFLFFLGLSGAVIARDVEKPSASFSGLIIPMNMENNDIEFEYYPIKDSSFTSLPIMNTDSDVIDFDYSPKDDTQSTAISPYFNIDRGGIQFDYSPKTINCRATHC